MKRAATLLALAVLLAFSARQVAASTGTTPPLKAASADNLKPAPPTAPPNTILNFTVTDMHGRLLTCAKQQVDTDTFSGCTLAPGRTLDDLMTTIVQAIRAEQQKISAEEK